MRKNILYIIDSLAVGGAEMLLSSTLNELSRHAEITLVYMENRTELLPTFHPRIKTYCLNYKGKRDFFKAVWKLRKIIRERNIEVINAQLYWSSLVAKVTAPSHVQIVLTIHNLMSQDVFDNSKAALLLEKLTNRRNQRMIFVTREAMLDYDRQVGIPGKHMVIYNPIQSRYIAPSAKTFDPSKRVLKLVTIGNLRKQKNYPFLIEAMKLVNEEEIYVDIYGEGVFRDYIEQEIARHNLKIKLKGINFDISDELQGYDAFVMTSSFEGYGIAVVEAMASGLPVLLSDIPVLREVTAGQGFFFSLQHPQELANLLKDILQGRVSPDHLASTGRQRAIEIGHIDRYYQRVLSFYEEA